jgi:hypothetical protein
MNWIHYEEPEASNNNRKTIISLILRLSRPPKFSFACSSSELRLPSYTRLISRTNSPPSLSVAVRPYRKQRARARGVLLIQYSQWLRLALSFVPLIIISLCSPMTLPELSLVFLASSPSLSPRHSRRHSWASGAWAALKKSSESAKWSNIDSWEGGREGAAKCVVMETWSSRGDKRPSVRPSVRPDFWEGWVLLEKQFFFLLVRFRYFLLRNLVRTNNNNLV